MKKLISIISILFCAFVAFAQTNPTSVTPNAILDDAYYKYIWATDTLTNADTISFVYRVKGTQTMDINIGLYSDHVSGTASGTLVGYYSYDGVNYFSLGDTITVSSISADAFDSQQLDYADYNYPYLKLTYTQSGTAVTVQHPFIYAKYN